MILNNPFEGKVSHSIPSLEANRYFPKSTTFTKPYGLIKNQQLYTPSFELSRSPFYDSNLPHMGKNKTFQQNPFKKNLSFSRTLSQSSRYCDCPCYYGQYSQSSFDFDEPLYESKVEPFKYSMKKATPEGINRESEREPKLKQSHEVTTKKTNNILNKYGITTMEDHETKFKEEQEKLLDSRMKFQYEKDSFGKQTSQMQEIMYQTFQKVEHEEFSPPESPTLRRPEKDMKGEEFPDDILYEGRNYHRIMI